MKKTKPREWYDLLCGPNDSWAYRFTSKKDAVRIVKENPYLDFRLIHVREVLPKRRGAK